MRLSLFCSESASVRALAAVAQMRVQYCTGFWALSSPRGPVALEAGVSAGQGGPPEAQSRLLTVRDAGRNDGGSGSWAPRQTQAEALGCAPAVSGREGEGYDAHDDDRQDARLVAPYERQGA